MHGSQTIRKASHQIGQTDLSAEGAKDAVTLNSNCPSLQGHDPVGGACAADDAAKRGELVWFTDIADEHDALRKGIEALQGQKVSEGCASQCAPMSRSSWREAQLGMGNAVAQERWSPQSRLDERRILPPPSAFLAGQRC